eukprot:Sspe_Gene.55675::Locus_30617_Transcript_1_1_Confidence_1.000_Length_1266::g.55675::m.55675
MPRVSSYYHGVYIPQMPTEWYDDREPVPLEDLKEKTFEFRMHHDGWNSLITLWNTYPGAKDPPVFHITASGSNEELLVNQEFMWRFMKGYEKANPHVVRVKTPNGMITLHTSEEFWNRFVTLATQWSQERHARGEYNRENTTVVSSMMPGMEPIRTTLEDWENICRSWEREKRITPEHINSMIQRGVGGAPPPQQQTNEFMQLQTQLSDAAQSAQAHAQHSAQVAEELRAAKMEAQRYRHEAETYKRERDQMEDRLGMLESQLARVQADLERQRSQCTKDIQARESELVAARQAADVADLKKELQMRELMQEELCRVKEEAMREVEKCRSEMMQAHQTELCEMRRYLIDSPMGHQHHACPHRRPCCPSPQHTRLHAPRKATTHVTYCGQRTVATQTPP